MADDDDRYEDDEATSRARAFWSGTITFGLVSVPVELYPANRPQRVALRMLDGDGTPLRRQFYDPEKDRPVDNDELVRGYELDDGSFVIVTDEELEALEPRKSRDIDLRLFVDSDELDPLYFERAYFLAPSGESNKAYRLLAETMERTGKAGIATFVMRTKEYLIAILAENGILRAETLRFHDEVRSADELELPASEAADTTARAVRKEIAKRKQKSLPKTELKDEYADRLRALVEEKRRKGVDVVSYEGDTAAADTGDDSIIDLMEVLKRSMRAVDEGEAGAATRGTRRAAKQASSPAKKGAATRGTRRAAKQASPPAKKGAATRSRVATTQQRRAAKTAATKGSAATGLAGLTKEELYERAQRLAVPGRSGMSKAQLVRALREAG